MSKYNCPYECTSSYFDWEYDTFFSLTFWMEMSNKSAAILTSARSSNLKILFLGEIIRELWNGHILVQKSQDNYRLTHNIPCAWAWCLASLQHSKWIQVVLHHILWRRPVLYMLAYLGPVLIWYPAVLSGAQLCRSPTRRFWGVLTPKGLLI